MRIYTCIAVLLLMKAICLSDISLPEALKAGDGTTIQSPKNWQQNRRKEILELFRTHIYGRAPVGRPEDLRLKVAESTTTAMSGMATRKQVEIHFSGPGGDGKINLILFVPKNVTKPVPGFVLICHRSPENIDPTRNIKRPYWPAEDIVKRGYMAAAFLASDLDPDHFDGFNNGVHGIFDPNDVPRPDDAWGTIAAWAWGASRTMDYFESDSEIDETRIGVIGHSRGGKAALWCGAEDERFSLVISNDSGCTGAALARRKKGETIKNINGDFPHWFCENYKKFNDREDHLPVDQHMLIALMAPRGVYVASATEDAWADPEGEFLSCVHAEPVYALHGLTGLGTDQMPPADQPIHKGHIGYHLRRGNHDLTAYDWSCYMDYADTIWAK